MQPVQKKTVITKEGISLYYETKIRAKTDPILFFLHGIGGDLDAWQFVGEDLSSRGFSLVAMDLRGHGYSDHPKYEKGYEIESIGNGVL